MTTQRGRCQACRYRFPLKKDGTLVAHRIYGSGPNVYADENLRQVRWHYCTGEGHKPMEAEVQR